MLSSSIPLSGTVSALSSSIPLSGTFSALSFSIPLSGTISVPSCLSESSFKPPPAQMHSVCRHMKHRDYSKYSEEAAQNYMELIYKQTDDYIGSFMHYLDEGWTIFVVSDHALICAEYERPNFGDVSGINVGLMRDLGFTVMK